MEMPAVPPFVRIDVDLQGGCGIDAQRELYCWGYYALKGTAPRLIATDVEWAKPGPWILCYQRTGHEAECSWFGDPRKPLRTEVRALLGQPNLED
jgi:hypothetical protein